MASDDDFITRLIGFGLTEKEAQCYFYLLKYGPKIPSPLAKSLHTYREDVHRTLNSLIEKGMVRPSLDSPTLYIAVELTAALDGALKKHESELREMEQRKQELAELSRQQHFRPSDEVSTFKIIKNVRELLATTAAIILACEKEFFVVVVENTLTLTSVYDINPLTKAFIEGGGRARVLVTNLQHKGIQVAQELIDIGVELRVVGRETAIFGAWDRKNCLSGIHWVLDSISLDQPLTALFTDDPAYAKYLESTFEVLWQQSVPAEERIQELREQGPPLRLIDRNTPMVVPKTVLLKNVE